MVGDLFIKHYCIMLSCNFENFDVIWRLKNPIETVSLYYQGFNLKQCSSLYTPAVHFPFLMMHLIYLKNFAKALFSISLGTAVIPRRTEKQRLCKIRGQKRCIMGNVEMCGVYKILNAHLRNFFVVVFWSRGALSSRTG